jgi:beta-N-acetylhexosaminidase
MLGTEEGDEIYSSRPQPLDRVDAIGVNAALVGHQSDPSPLDQVSAVAQQHGESRLYPGRIVRAGRRTAGSARAGVTPRQESYNRECAVHRSLLFLSLIGLGACGGIPPAGHFPLPTPTPAFLDQAAIRWSPPTMAERHDMRRLLESLSNRDKIAQLVMPWITGSYVSYDDTAFARVQRWVDSLHVGGIIVSIGSPMDIAAKLNRLQRIAPFPLLVASDLESGSSFRLNGGTPFPTNMGVAAAGSDLDAYEMGRITALEGRAVGIHLTFAPVADVNNNPANPIINTRSFGEDPALVARLVAAEVRGLQENGMYATAKHFPGHGDTGTDSHISLPVITADWPRLDSVELVPFRAAVNAGVTAVMSAHIALPGVDQGQNRPATVAPNILTGVLRDSLAFKGLIVTDALNMGALVNSYGAGEATVLAFLAGADLLLQPADPAVAIDAMVAALDSGRYSLGRLDSSVSRILDLKSRLGLFSERLISLDRVPAFVGAAGFQRIAEEVTGRSIVLVKDSANTVDSIRARPRPLTVVAYGDDAGATLIGDLRGRGYRVNSFRIYPQSGPASYDSARVMLEGNGIAVFVTAVRATAWSGNIGLPVQFTALMDSTARRKRTVLISFGSPYLISSVPSIGSYLLGWQSRGMSERAMAAALAGSAPITGKLPISIPGGGPIGYGIRRLKVREGSSSR